MTQFPTGSGFHSVVIVPLIHVIIEVVTQRAAMIMKADKGNGNNYNKVLTERYRVVRYSITVDR